MGINQLGFAIKTVGHVDKNGLALHEIIHLATGTPLILRTRHETTEQASTIIEEYVRNNLRMLRSMVKNQSKGGDPVSLSPAGESVRHA